MKSFWTGMVASALMLSASVAMAGSGTQASPTWLSMVVTGHIVVDPDGAVASYALDDPASVPPGAAREMAKVAIKKGTERIKSSRAGSRPCKFTARRRTRLAEPSNGARPQENT